MVTQPILSKIQLELTTLYGLNPIMVYLNLNNINNIINLINLIKNFTFGRMWEENTHINRILLLVLIFLIIKKGTMFS